MTLRLLQAACACWILIAMPVRAQEDLPWRNAIAQDQPTNALPTVEARASVTVSNGIAYNTFTSWRDNERALFRRQYPDHIATIGRDGEFYWSFDGESQQEGAPFLGYVVLGHQFHAFLINTPAFINEAPEFTDSSLCDCRAAQMPLKTGQLVNLHYDRETGRPRIHMANDGQGNDIRTEYLDWRDLGQYTLPFHIRITHAGREFDYRFSEISLGEQLEYETYMPPFNTLTAEQQLIRLHRNSIDAHIASDVSLMSDNWAEDIIMVGRGNINTVSRAAAVERLGQSLKRRKHSLYIDLERPIVRLSDDESMGEVYVRVHAEGNTVHEDGSLGDFFEFTAAWQATYQKIEGSWKMISNSSSFE